MLSNVAQKCILESRTQAPADVLQAWYLPSIRLAIISITHTCDSMASNAWLFARFEGHRP